MLVMKLGVVILAAGQGKRMRSSLPKVLHLLAGRPLLQHVLEVARSLSPERITVVYGHGGEQVPQAIGAMDLSWIRQDEQRGTGDALRLALPSLHGLDQVLILYGDVPLLSLTTLSALLQSSETAPLALLTANLTDPSGYGRIIRDTVGRVMRIVEQRDAQPEELAVREVNTGIMVCEAGRLEAWLQRLRPANAQGEYYLTDIVAMAVDEGIEVETIQPEDVLEMQGVNDHLQLAWLERAYQAAQARRLMEQGVTLMDPARFDLRGQLSVGRDVVIDIDVILEGEVSLGDGVRVGAYSKIINSTLAEDVWVMEHCLIDSARIGSGCRIGPFARIRPQTELAEQVHIGNFVELKQATVGPGSKINHLSYMGDVVIGRNVNVGAGTITCNYDGAYKHVTRIGDEAFIGSDTQLVAPVSVGVGATIGAGSTITTDTPEHQLSLSRAPQTSVPGWRRPQKKPTKE